MPGRKLRFGLWRGMICSEIGLGMPSEVKFILKNSILSLLPSSAVYWRNPAEDVKRSEFMPRVAMLGFANVALRSLNLRSAFEPG
jgi:hypothetical protein